MLFGRHQDQRVAAGNDVLDDLLLGTAKARAAEHPIENLCGRLARPVHGSPRLPSALKGAAGAG